MQVIVNLPVSKQCQMLLLANGPYDRQGVENFIKMLQLHVELGAFDEPAKPDTPNG